VTGPNAPTVQRAPGHLGKQGRKGGKGEGKVGEGGGEGGEGYGKKEARRIREEGREEWWTEGREGERERRVVRV